MQRLPLCFALTSLLLLTAVRAHASGASTSAASTNHTQASGKYQIAVTPQERIRNAAANSPGTSWIIGVGVAITETGYIGYSRQYTPLPMVFYHNGRFFFAGASVGYVIAHGNHYRLSAIAVPEINRLSASDSPRLAGIKSRRWSVNGGASLDVFGDWGRLNVSALHDLLDRNDGAEVDAGYTYALHFGRLALSPALGVRWESSNLTNYLYGVSPAEVIAGRQAYTPGSAISPYAALGFSERLTTHWEVAGQLQYLRFASAIKDSPIIDRHGSTTLFIGVLYSPKGS